jgi:hypothetical protein
MPPTTNTVPVNDPAHPAHQSWLTGLMKILEALTAIAPAVVTIASPQNAALAGQMAELATVAEQSLAN